MPVTLHDVEYLCRTDERLLARVYQPQGPGPFPTVVDVHGGAWCSGDRTSNEPIARHLAEAGVLVVALDFRSGSVAAYPGPVQDIHVGLRWVAQHAAEYGGTTPVGGLGTSSGAHQLLLCALRPHDPVLASVPLDGGDEAPEVSFVVACWPALDPKRRYEAARAAGRIDLVTATTSYFPTEAAINDGNPMRIVANGLAERLPPILILQGLADENVDPTWQEDFVTAYRAAGGELSLVTYDAMPHAFVNVEPRAAATADALARIREFVRIQAQRTPTS